MNSKIDCPISLKAADVSRLGRISGYAATWGVDQGRDRIERGAFSAYLKSTNPDKATWPKMLWAHDSSAPIGRWTDMRETASGLKVEGEILNDVQKGREALALLRAQAIRGLSIGFKLDKWSFDERRRVRVLEAITLREVSVVALPMNLGARVTTVKEAEVDSELEREAIAFATHCLDELALPTSLSIRFEKAVDRLGALGEFDPRDADEITVRAGMSRRQTLVTLGHEIKHMAQSRRGAFGLQRKAIDLPANERKSLEDEAETFAVLALDRYESALEAFTSACRKAARDIRKKTKPPPESRPWAHGWNGHGW